MVLLPSPGVAFEQGKTLPTPETVPFRLTRDLVDGMGIAGVEGVFRRCCEETMVVMKASHEELRTIVEVRGGGGGGGGGGGEVGRGIV